MSTETQGAGAEPVVTTNVPAPTEGDKSQVKAEDTKSPEAATEGESSDGTTPTDEGDQPKPKRADGGFQRRINRLTADYREAQAKAEAAERRAAELESRLTKPVQDDIAPPRPRLEKFNTYEEWEEADRAWVREETRRETLKTLEKERSKDQAKKAETEAHERRVKARETFEDEAEKVAEHYEDFDEFLEDLWKGRSPIRNLAYGAQEYAFEDATRRPELLYHLHMNPDVADKIAALRPSKQIAELARLEASLPKPGAKTVSKAPAPPKMVGAKGGPDGKDPEKMSVEEHRRATGTVRKVDY